MQLRHFGKLFLASLSFILSLLLFVGCQKASVQTYKDDVAAADLTDRIREEIHVPSGYETYDSEFLSFYLSEAVDLVDDYSVIYAIAPDDYTEIGVLHLRPGSKLEALANSASGYLDYFKNTYQTQAEQYDPSERQKLKDASCHVYGNYVVYTIMTSETQKSCDKIIESTLKAN